MQQLIVEWLNSSRKEYYTGLILLRKIQPTAAIIRLLERGPNDHNRKLLLKHLTEAVASKPEIFLQAPVAISKKEPITSPIAQEPAADHSQSAVYLSAKKEADQAYKALMNERAVLFSGVRSVMIHEDINAPVLVEARKKSCINIVLEWQKISKLYDRADFVLKNGVLPTGLDKKEDADVASIPDQLVKQNLDNARKNYNKMKKRPQTTERLQRLAELEILIKKLEGRWQLLKLDK